MKRRFRISVVLIIICVLCGCANTHEAGKTNQASVIETDSFSIIEGRPFVIREGAAYCWTEDNEWERYGAAENLDRLYGEDYFIALDLEGAIICEGYSDEEENLSLSAGYASYMRDKMLELNQVYSAAALNMGEDWRVLLKDGRVMVFMLAQNGESEYQETSIDNEKIVDIAGDYALTDSGKVYRGAINSRNIAKDTNGDGVMEIEVEEWFEWELLASDKSVTAICASRTSGICVGINDNQTVNLWKPQGNNWELDLSEWGDISEVSVGFNYVLGLTKEGRVLYAYADKDNEAEITSLLQDKKHVAHIASAYQTIALLYQDGTVEMIDV